MLKIVFSLVFFVMVFIHVYPQKNGIKIGYITDNSGIQYERSLGKQWSIIGQFGYSAIPITSESESVDYSEYAGIGLYFEGRYYFSTKKDLMEGWHIGPYYHFMKGSSKSTDAESTIYLFGGTSGYQWVFNSNLTIDLLIGIGFGTWSTEEDEVFPLPPIVLPNLGFTLGYNF